MLNFLRRKPPIDLASSTIWPALGRAMPLLAGLSEAEWNRLESRMNTFLAEKAISGAHDFELDETVLLTVAAQACLPLINLDDSAYRGWSDVVIYPASFISREAWRDASGLVHEGEQHVAGMARSDGPVLLSWPDSRRGPALDGRNVVIHECAHKLDMRDDSAANGFPPLHAEMDRAAWTKALSRAYADFSHKVANGFPVAIDPYAATDPAEFFAVVSEYFFELPHLLHLEYPAVYEQLRQFYRQDPGLRLPVIGVEEMEW
ncbi:zinc-dependent peptidase [Chitinimonas arctica]|uniref:Zinc-dependent peptidase n=1 Tax=Chitinimonas arctica TaxID=2594795 RepID=A0A516SDG8_9NEIS|nr:M90 family metallopeptidase [Chitinimonas arctica]QDQ26078.1 zinc-dependent peptidase [Chitinimonas arctica]